VKFSLGKMIELGACSTTSETRGNLLIVDDETEQMRGLCDALALEGYATRGFIVAKDALAAVQPGEFDLLLTDLFMPDMDGLALSTAVQLRDPTIGVVLMTGDGTIDTAVHALRHGVLDYISKPFELKAILPVIERTILVGRLRREVVELKERQRRSSEKLAAASRDLDSFSYSISHDLRAPLRSISGFANLLYEDFAEELGDEGRRLLGIIRSSCLGMDQLIVGLSDFSRAGAAPLDPELIDMTLMADAVAREVLTTYSGPTPLIEIGELPSARADAKVIRQVWTNLIGNALKYSAKRSEPKVTIDGWVEAHEAIYEIEDNGTGFDMAYASKLFGVFQRLHKSDDFPGIGVGLAIVHRILTRHGGRIIAEGRPDVGARFQFALPT
jgi:two-component system sensor histidine kinase/response regulator